MPSFNDYIVFVDESGDHGLSSIDPNYPVFILAFCLFDKTTYAERLVPSILKLKFKYFGHEQIILHETDIRKAKGSFKCLLNSNTREHFLNDLNSIIENNEFLLIASAIQKNRLREQYYESVNPYHIGMGFGLERIFLHLNGLGCKDGITYLLFESRGRKEDNDLELEFRRICAKNATGHHLPFDIILVDKKSNSSGLQLSDLTARPIGRNILDPEQPNRAFDIIKRKFRRNAYGNVRGWGLKVFP